MPCPTEPSRPWPLALATAALVAACAQPLPAPAPAAPPSAPPSPAPQVLVVTQPAVPAAADLATRQLLQASEQLRTMPPAEQAAELARLLPATTPGDTLRAVLLLAQSRQPGDLARALTLLDPLVREESPWAAPARLLQARLAEQRRLEELAERQAQQLREQQRRLEQLGQQLDALRAIERSLGTRPPPAPASTPRTP